MHLFGKSMKSPNKVNVCTYARQLDLELSYRRFREQKLVALGEVPGSTET